MSCEHHSPAALATRAPGTGKPGGTRGRPSRGAAMANATCAAADAEGRPCPRPTCACQATLLLLEPSPYLSLSRKIVSGASGGSSGLSGLAAACGWSGAPSGTPGPDGSARAGAGGAGAGGGATVATTGAHAHWPRKCRTRTSHGSKQPVGDVAGPLTTLSHLRQRASRREAETGKGRPFGAASEGGPSGTWRC